MANYTPNYQLHQWEPQDPFLRTDFNQDLSKIDTALNGLAEDMSQKAEQTELDEVRVLATRSRFTKLKEFYFSDQMPKIEFDLSDIDWAKWDKVHLDGIPTNGSQMLLYLNKVTSGGYVLYFNGAQGNYMPRITFHVGYQPKRTVVVSQCDSVFRAEFAYVGLKKAILTNGVMPEGSSFSIWGEA